MGARWRQRREPVGEQKSEASAQERRKKEEEREEC